MLRLAVIFVLLFSVAHAAVAADPFSPSVAQVDEAIEKVVTTVDAAVPGRDSLLKSYRDTRSLLLALEQRRSELEKYTAGRANAQAQAQLIRDERIKSQATLRPSPADDVALAELEQLIQVDKADLAVLRTRLGDVSAKQSLESARPKLIRERVAELGALQTDLEANRALVSKSVDPGSADEARLWLAQVQYADNRAEKASLDAELLSRPMRLELLSAQRDQLTRQVALLEEYLLAMERQAGLLRQGEADEVIAAAETAQADALGKHPLVQQLANKNAVFSSTLGARSTAINGFRDRELEAEALAQNFERDLKTIERKLEILGMNKTVGEILREQAVRLPGKKATERELTAIALEIGASSLRRLELQDEKRELRDVQVYIDSELARANVVQVGSISIDLLDLSLNRRELVGRAIDVENTYARALTDLDFSVHRLASAVEEYRAFISERLLWVQSRDSLSWSLFTDIPGQITESFTPSRWLQAGSWLLSDLHRRPLSLLLLAVFFILLYVTPTIKTRLFATGHAVGFVRSDSFADTLRALSYSLILMLKWPLLMLLIALPFKYHEAEVGLEAALFYAFSRTTVYFLGLEFMRTLLLPRGLVEAHFRWPTQRVVSLNRRVRRFEQIFLPAVFFTIFFDRLYPTDVGGSLGTFALMISLLSMAYFFYRMPRFVQNKMDLFLAEPKARINGYWGSAVRTILAWTPIVMIVSVLFGYNYTAIEFTLLLIQTVFLFTGMLLLHELGMRWLRLTRRRLRLKVQEGIAQAAVEDSDTYIDEEMLEHDPEILDDEGTKFLNTLLLFGSMLGVAVVWSDVFPALGILDSVELWQRTDSVNGEDLVVQITLADFFSALAIGIVGWVVVRRLPSLLEILLRQRMDVGAASAYAVGIVTKYVITTAIFVTVLSMLGGSWSQIQWAVAALSLGIGFGLQEIVANFFSGLIILFEQPIRVGDTVTVGETSGVVTKIQMRATTIRDWDRRELLVPNKEFVTSRLLNWSLTDPVTRIHIEVGVAYGSDVDQALEIVRQAALAHPMVMADPAPFVTFDKFGADSLELTLRCYVEELDKRLSIASAIRLDINRNLKEASIVVAYPQRDVHLDASAPLDIRLVNPTHS
jgi:potassium efflux system protein